MATDLIDGQKLADNFLAILPPSSPTIDTNIGSSGLKGRVDLFDVEQGTLAKLPYIFSPNILLGYDVQKLFSGDMSAYNDDHSAADLALCGHMVSEGLAPDQVDIVFRASGLYRGKWDEMRGPITYGHRTISKAFEG